MYNIASKTFNIQIFNSYNHLQTINVQIFNSYNHLQTINVHVTISSVVYKYTQIVFVQNIVSCYKKVIFL